MAKKRKTWKVEPDDTREIGKRLQRIRNEKGLSQQETADRTGLTARLVSDYERGRIRIHGELLVRFCTALECEPSEILGMKPKKEKISPSLLRLMKRIEGLPSSDRKALITVIEKFLRGAKS